MGSWLFLGVILTSLDLEADSESDSKVGVPAPDRCGTCTRCIDACPTDAFIAPYQLDSSRCIAYLTIEKRGALPEDEELRSGMGRHVFGCDICQDVCPWNRKAPATKAAEFQPRRGLGKSCARLAWQRSARKISGARFAARRCAGRSAQDCAGMRSSPWATAETRNFFLCSKKLAGDEDEVVAESAAWAIQKLSLVD